MIFRFLKIFALIFFLFSCIDKEKNGLTKDNPQDKIKVIETSYFSAKLMFGKLEKESLESKQIFKYDDKGNEIETKKYDSDGSLESKQIFKYDDKGNRIEESIYGFDGSLNYKYKYILYKYDDTGNWIERKSYDSISNKYSKIYERKIDYYN